MRPISKDWKPFRIEPMGEETRRDSQPWAIKQINIEVLEERNKIYRSSRTYLLYPALAPHGYVRFYLTHP